MLPVDEVAELALEMKGRGVRARGKAANLQLALMAQGGLMEEAEEMFQVPTSLTTTLSCAGGGGDYRGCTFVWIHVVC